MGFSKTITMPVLVMPKDTKKMFQSPDLLFYNATLPVMHVEGILFHCFFQIFLLICNVEANKIASLRASWDFLRIFTSILYPFSQLYLQILFDYEYICTVVFSGSLSIYKGPPKTPNGKESKHQFGYARNCCLLLCEYVPCSFSSFFLISPLLLFVGSAGSSN